MDPYQVGTNDTIVGWVLTMIGSHRHGRQDPTVAWKTDNHTAEHQVDQLLADQLFISFRASVSITAVSLGEQIPAAVVGVTTINPGSLKSRQHGQQLFLRLSSLGEVGSFIRSGSITSTGVLLWSIPLIKDPRWFNIPCGERRVLRCETRT